MKNWKAQHHFLFYGTIAAIFGGIYLYGKYKKDTNNASKSNFSGKIVSGTRSDGKQVRVDISGVNT